MRYVRVHYEIKKTTLKKIIFIFLFPILVIATSYNLIHKIEKDAISNKNIKINIFDKNKIQNVTYYFVQVGYFNNLKNAQAYSKTLKEKGINNSIINKNGYIVIAAIENNNIYTKNIEKHLINLHVSYIIKSVELSVNNKIIAEIIDSVSKQIRILNGNAKSEQLSIDNEIKKIRKYCKDETLNKMIIDLAVKFKEFNKNYSSKKYDDCLSNLADEIFLLQQINDFISQLI